MAKNAKNNKDNKEIKNKRHFFKDFKAELKKVIWPTPKQVVNNTVAVITIVLITAIIVFILDLVFDIINDQGINKLKSNLRNKVVVENNVDDNNVASDENNQADETPEPETEGDIGEGATSGGNESSEENAEQ